MTGEVETLVAGHEDSHSSTKYKELVWGINMGSPMS